MAICKFAKLPNINGVSSFCNLSLRLCAWEFYRVIFDIKLVRRTIRRDRERVIKLSWYKYISRPSNNNETGSKLDTKSDYSLHPLLRIREPIRLKNLWWNTDIHQFTVFPSHPTPTLTYLIFPRVLLLSAVYLISIMWSMPAKIESSSERKTCDLKHAPHSIKWRHFRRGFKNLIPNSRLKT